MTHLTFNKYGAEEVISKEGQYRAGTQFVFMALGWDAEGKSFWYPPPGPDYLRSVDEVVSEGMLCYEFLIPESRKAFEDLPKRYESRRANKKIVKERLE